MRTLKLTRHSIGKESAGDKGRGRGPVRFVLHLRGNSRRSNPRHAEHARNVIAHALIDAKHALFDLSTLPDLAVSRALFGDRVLVEWKAFAEAQAATLDIQPRRRPRTAGPRWSPFDRIVHDGGHQHCGNNPRGSLLYLQQHT